MTFGFRWEESTRCVLEFPFHSFDPDIRFRRHSFKYSYLSITLSVPFTCWISNRLILLGTFQNTQLTFFLQEWMQQCIILSSWNCRTNIFVTLLHNNGYIAPLTMIWFSKLKLVWKLENGPHNLFEIVLHFSNLFFNNIIACKYLLVKFYSMWQSIIILQILMTDHFGSCMIQFSPNFINS